MIARGETSDFHVSRYRALVINTVQRPGAFSLIVIDVPALAAPGQRAPVPFKKLADLTHADHAVPLRGGAMNGLQL